MVSIAQPLPSFDEIDDEPRWPNQAISAGLDHRWDTIALKKEVTEADDLPLNPEFFYSCGLHWQSLDIRVKTIEHQSLGC